MSEKALDLDDFMCRVQDDKELLFELLDIFIGDFHIKRQSLQEAMEKNDQRTIRNIAHFLKGSCGNISAKPLRDIFFELEEGEKQNSLEDFKGYLCDIDEKFEALLVAIGELRTKLC